MPSRDYQRQKASANAEGLAAIGRKVQQRYHKESQCQQVPEGVVLTRPLKVHSSWIERLQIFEGLQIKWLVVRMCMGNA